MTYLNDSISVTIFCFVVRSRASLALADESEFVFEDLLTVFRNAEPRSSQRRHVRDRHLVAAPFQEKQNVSLIICQFVIEVKHLLIN